MAQLRPAGTKFMCERVATNDDDDDDNAEDDNSDNDFDDNDDDEPDAEAQDDTGNRLYNLSLFLTCAHTHIIYVNLYRTLSSTEAPTQDSGASIAVVAGATVGIIAVLATVVVMTVITGVCCINPTCPFYKWRLKNYQNVA